MMQYKIPFKYFDIVYGGRIKKSTPRRNAKFTYSVKNSPNCFVDYCFFLVLITAFYVISLSLDF